MNDWIPIDEVTPDNCPDGSKVMIRWDKPGEKSLFIDGVVRWKRKKPEFYTISERAQWKTPDAVLPCAFLQ